MQVNEKERRELQEIFDLVDRDKGGSISPDELYQLMKTIGAPATRESVNQVKLFLSLNDQYHTIQYQPI